MLKVVMARGIFKKKVNDLKAQKLNVVSLEQTIGKQNVISSKLKIDESNNLCGLELIMVTICNSNDDITPNTYWEFQLKNGGLDCFKIYIHQIKCT